MTKVLGVVDPAFVSQCKRTQKLRGQFYDTMPPLTDPKEQKMFILSQKRLLNEDIFEELMENCQHKPLNLAMEPVFAQVFQAYRAIFWKYDVYSNSFYSKTLEARLEGDDTIIPAALQARMPINVASIENRLARQKLQVESRSPQLVFPLYLKSGDTIAVIQISRNKGEATFTDENIQDATFFMKKFSLYGTSVAISSTVIDTANNLSCVKKTKEVINTLTTVYKTAFEAQDVDYWCYREKENQFFRYDYKEDNFMVVKKSKVGVVGFCLMTKVSINERNVKYHSNYNSTIDGKSGGAILTYVEKVDDIVYAIALRGKNGDGFYSNNQKIIIEKISPFAILSIAYSFKLHPLPQRLNQDTSKPIFDLIKFAKEVLKVSEVDKIAVFIEKWLSEHFQKPVSVCMKFGNTLISGYGGDELSLNITGLNDSLMGLCISEQKTQFYDTSDPLFNPDVDSAGHADVKEIIIVPIFSASNETLGAVSVSSMDEFGEIADQVVRKLSAFAVFCGISLQNALALRIASFCPNMIIKAKTDKITNQQDVVDLAFDYFHEIKGVLSATVFLAKGDGLEKVAGAGEPIDSSSDYAILAFKENSPKTFRVPDAAEKTDYNNNDQKIEIKSVEQNNGEERPAMPNSVPATPAQNDRDDKIQKAKSVEQININTNDKPVMPNSVPESTIQNDKDDKIQKSKSEEKMIRVDPNDRPAMPNSVPATPAQNDREIEVQKDSSLVRVNNNRAMTPYADFYGSYFICSPIFAQETGKTVGVFQYCVHGPDSIVNAISHASIAAAYISSIAGADEQVKQMNNEGLSEITGPAVPDKLRTGIDFASDVFDSNQFNSRELAIAVAEFIEKDGLSKSLDIDIGVFIKFVREIFANCTATFHDYHHSVDVFSQCVKFCQPSYGQVLLPIERLALYVAALSHDALHDGFANIKLGILYESMLKLSPLEVKSAAFLEKCMNEFNFLGKEEDKKEVISIASRLILATDMSKHFEILEKAQKLADDDKFSLEDKETRIMTTEVLIKAADLGSANRTSELADKKGLPDEFFAQGDLSRVEGISYDRDGKARKNVHWGDSEPAFFKGVLIPTFDTLIMLLPDLEDIKKRVEENINNWIK